MSKKTMSGMDINIAGKKIELATMYPLIREKLDAGGSFSLTITGTSMWPFILGGRDRVTLSPITGRLKKNDLPLYIRTNGQFVLHRIIKVHKDGTYTCCGDHQWQKEPGLNHDQMVAIATAYVRKGKKITNRNMLYRMYKTVWTWMIPLRRYCFGLHRRWNRWFRRKAN